MRKLLRYVTILLILTIALSFRLPNLERIPHWYWDEGVNMNIAWNLVNGKALWFSLEYPFVPHPPMFFIIGGILLRFGNELVVMRALSVAYGILTLMLIYLIGREFLKENALLPAFLFAIYPVAIYWNRMAFANNQLMFLVLLAMYSFWKYFRGCRFVNETDRWLYVGSFAAGLAMITELIGFSLIVSIFVIFWIYKNKKDEITKVLSLSLIPPSIYVVLMLVLMPSAFIHDILFTLRRFGITISSILVLSLISILTYTLRRRIIVILIHLRNFYKNLIYGIVSFPVDENIAKRRVWSNVMLFLFLLNLMLGITLITPFNDDILFEGIDYFWLGIFGLFMIKSRVREFLLAFFLPLFMFNLITGRSDHLIIPLLPFFCFGLAVFLREIYTFMNVNNPALHLAILILLSYPFAFVLYHDVSGFILGRNLIWEDIENRAEVADFINSRVDPEDIVLTNSHMSRFIKCRTSVLLQTIAIQGRNVSYMASDYGFDRFEFDCSYPKVRFIAISFEADEWLSENDREIFLAIQEWRKQRIGRYIIYENPSGTQDMGGKKVA